MTTDQTLALLDEISDELDKITLVVDGLEDQSTLKPLRNKATKLKTSKDKDASLCGAKLARSIDGISKMMAAEGRKLEREKRKVVRDQEVSLAAFERYMERQVRSFGL